MTMQPAHLDYETRSACDLKKHGLARYVSDPTTSAICASYAIGDGPVRRWKMGEAPPADLLAHVAAGGELWAHNAPFEYAVWHMVCGWPAFPLEQMHCTMAGAYAMALPGNLENAAVALGLPVRKDTEGRALMLRLARPRKLDPLTWWEDEDKLQRLYAYCDQDVVVERALHARLVPLSPTERKVWLMDQRINLRGFAVDLDTARAGTAMAGKLALAYDAELAELTGNEVTSVNAMLAFKTWLARQGCPTDSLAKDAIVDLLATVPKKTEPVVFDLLSAIRDCLL